MFAFTEQSNKKIITDLFLNSENSPRICYRDNFEDSFRALPLKGIRVVTNKKRKQIEQRVYGVQLEGNVLNIRYDCSREKVLDEHHWDQVDKLDSLFSQLLEGKKQGEINPSFENTKDMYAYFCLEEQ